MTFSKEQLIARINQVTAINKYRISREQDADGLAMDNELFSIALASLEAEPVAWTWEIYGGGNMYAKIKPASLDANPLYTAPPAQVVPDMAAVGEMPFLGTQEKAFVSGWNACRAAMLHGAEPVTTAYKLRDAVETIRNSGIEIDAEKIFAERDALNSPVIPDGWKLVPIELTGDMTNAMSEAILDDLHNVDVWRSVLAAAPQQEVK
ncbi:hypothetical protein ACAD15_002382 [Enterobacter bugandensis]